jgi:hypothetical protein
MIGRDLAIIVATMKNEGPYVLEWVAHHLAVGFDGFLMFTNDCDDLTDRILDRLATRINVKHQPNPKSLFPEKGNWHVMALRYARLFNIYRDAGWILHLDADEFLQIKVGDRTLDAFANQAGNFDVVSFTSMAFNSGGALRLEPGFVTAQFTEYNKPYGILREDGRVEFNAIKTMFRNEVTFDLRRNHRPLRKDFSASDRIWIDGSGSELPPDFTDGQAKSINAINSTELAEFGHYAIKSAESFLLKVERGDAAGVDRLNRSKRYWNSYNTRGDTQIMFATKSAAFSDIYADLMSDPLLAEMHSEAFAIHQRKVASILQTAPGQQKAEWLGLSG